MDNPTDVKEFIANSRIENSSKDNLVKTYNYYCEVNGITWIRPKYKWASKIPNVPTTNDVDQLVAFASARYGTIFKLLAETGAMPIELHRVQRRDIDLDKRTTNITGSKRHSSRLIKLKPNMIAMLRTYLTKNKGRYPFK